MADSRDTKRNPKRSRSRGGRLQDMTNDKENGTTEDRAPHWRQSESKDDARGFKNRGNDFYMGKGPTRPTSNGRSRTTSARNGLPVTQRGPPRSVEVNGCRPKVLNTKPPANNSKPNFQEPVTNNDFDRRTSNHPSDPNRDRNARKRTMGFPFLKDMLGKDPSYIVIELTKRKDVLQDCLARTAREHDFLEVFLKVLAEAYLSKTTPKQMIGLFETLKEADFFNSVNLFLIDLSSKIEEECVDVHTIKTAIQNILSIAMAQLQRNPSSLFVFTRIYTMINQVVEGLNKIGSVDENVLDALHQFKELKKHSEKDKRPSRSDERPPDDFRSYPVSPCKAELLRTGRPFLRPNKVNEQYEDLDHYLDVQYRLLREDFVGPLREGLIEYIDSKQNRDGQAAGQRRRQTDIRIYENITIQSPVLTENGLGYKLQLSINASHRRIKWKQSKRLIYGSLVCLTDVDLNDFYIATVVDRDSIEAGVLTIHFVDESITVKDVLSKSFNMAESSAYYESYKHVLSGMQALQPGDLPFENYILGRNVDVARPSYLSTTETYDLRTLVDQNYTVHAESRLRNMGTVIRATMQDFSIKSKPAKSVNVSKLDSWPKKELLNLDESQYKAVQAALTKEFAIVQGPPGTGKTYIGLQIAKILLHNRSVWAGTGKTVKPMLIVCYTNHALDQFMEGIVKFFKGDILRIGGRSKSELLEELNIKKIRRMQHGPRTPIGIMQRNKNQARSDLRDKLQVISDVTSSIDLYRSEVIHERALRTVMGRLYNSLVDGMPNKRNRFKGAGFSYIFKWLGITGIQHECRLEAAKYVKVDEDDNITVDCEGKHRLRTLALGTSDDVTYGLNRDSVSIIRAHAIAFHANNNIPTHYETKWDEAVDKLYRSLIRSRLVRMISSVDIMSEEQESEIKQVWRLDQQTKWKLYRLWVHKFCIEQYQKIDDMRAEFEELSERYKEAEKQEDKEIMKHASVIGMTTSGAARYQAVLKEVGPNIVIVEEAAEVLEAHIAMSLSMSCRHLILIGDHKQLRPNPNVYHLAKKYNLDISLFERMVKIGMDYSSLKLQHRMRPQISDIVRHIYPSLEDHESVEKYPCVKGVSTNLHLINHDQVETRDGEGKSYSNPHEARYAIALCRYLLLQGYNRHQITILTTYTAQLFYMRNYLPREEFEGVNVTVVDNYQGEENDIVILSLVRSNTDDKIGFLKIENRICVALSRAKIGFYILGNFSHLAVHSELWKNVTDDMRGRGFLSNSLKLYCQNHPDENGIAAENAADFKDAPEGGCMRICDARLNCGHKCEKHCHILDPMHDQYQCRKRCIKRCDAEGHHQCKGLCYKECLPCSAEVTKVVPSCLHEQKMMCSTDPITFYCLVQIEVKLDCGHKRTKDCGEKRTRNCCVKIVYEWPCGHSSKIKCWQKETMKCPHPCDAILKCEHKCEGTCGTCFNGRLHISCRNECKSTLICGHQCGSHCNICLPCKMPCRNRCIHSRCQLKCGESCKVCTEPCAWRCQHYQCSKLCSEVCDRPKCNRPCPKRLKRCKHNCIGLCGEPCPQLCRKCDAEEVTTLFFGDEDVPNARFVLLEDCNHIFEYQAMDKFMTMKDEDDTIKLKRCPRCSTPIQKSLRYGNIINDILANIERVKIAMRGNTYHVKLFKKSVDPIQSRLSNHQLRLITLLGRIHADRRLSDLYTEMKGSVLLSEPQLISFQNQIELAKAWLQVKLDLKIKVYPLPETVAKFVHLQKKIMSTIFTLFDLFTEQQADDYSVELKRSRMVLKYCEIYKQLKRANKMEEAASDIDLLNGILLRGERFTEDDVTEAKECMNKLVELTTLKGLGITEEERLDIVKAVNLTKGHWFKCPNNHIYAIGECGGASQRAKCPECKSDIGGESHRLADGNTVASEMDGARFAAYSEEANNMANFDIDIEFLDEVVV